MKDLTKFEGQFISFITKDINGIDDIKCIGNVLDNTIGGVTSNSGTFRIPIEEAFNITLLFPKPKHRSIRDHIDTMIVRKRH